jgi:hypothetical protein
MENVPLLQFLVVVTDADQFPAVCLAQLLDKGRQNNVAFVLVAGSIQRESVQPAQRAREESWALD